MNKKQELKGNRIVKMALLNLIGDAMKKHDVYAVWMDEGYESNEDMIHFTFEGHKCTLVGIRNVNQKYSTIDLEIISDYEGEKNQRLILPVHITLLNVNTVEKIAEEAYNLLWNPEEDDEYEDVRKNYVANWLDTYLNN